MIGYQCSLATQTQLVANSMRAPQSSGDSKDTGNYTGASSPSSSSSSVVGSSLTATQQQRNNHQEDQDQNNEQQVPAGMKKSDCEATSAAAAAVLSSLSSHMNLINQQQARSKPTMNEPMNPNNNNNNSSTSGPNKITGSNSSSSSGALVSPGYHSAASSPGSSAASPSSTTSTGLSTTGLSVAHSSAHSHSPSSSSLASSSSSSSSSSCSRSPVSPNLLDYFPELNQDGLGLTWFHEANNRAKLGAALMTNRLLVAGDISLAEMSRYPVPIMARPPLGVSDITLENWLQDVVLSQPQKGIKLTFTSTRTVEPAFRVLARHAEHIKGPLILEADILARPTVAGSASSQASGGRGSKHSPNATSQQQQQQQQQQPVDAWTFLMLCRTRFPRCIISIGWCSSNHLQAGGQTAPNWQSESPLSSMADSSSSLHSSADSVFELDIMDSHLSGSHLLSNVAGSQPSHQVGHLQHLTHQHQQHRLQPYPTLAQHSQQHRNHHHHHHHLISHQQLSHQLSQHHASIGHHILSSNGSLNSSSGNSSGSPSPTSPISHLMSPPHQTVATNLSLGSKSTNLDSTEHHLFLAAAAAAERQQQHHHHHQQQQVAANCQSAAAAAAMAAAVMAATSFHHHHHQQQQQLPLNLNINEADQQQLPSSTQLTSLAHKIQSFHTISQHNMNHAAANQESVLSSKLYSSNPPSHQHKKPALGSVNGPRPSSPKQQLASSSHLLLKTTSGQHQQHNCGGGGGYTREMIDKMASLVKEYNLTQPVTFPVEARLLRNSLAELQRLLYQVGSNSTLTVVARPDDLISVDDLLTIRKAFATNQVLFDLPDELAAAFRQELELI